MISNFKIFLSIFALFILNNYNLYAQLFEVPIEMKIKSAPLILEGTITKSESFIGSDEKIYTAHKLEIQKIFKGTTFEKEELTIITMGGKVEELLVTYSHLLSLDTGQSGIFFLQSSKRPNIKNKHFPTLAMEVYSSSQGFLQIIEEDEKRIAIDPFNRFDDLQYQVFNKIIELTGEIPQVTSPNPNLIVGNDNKKKCLVFSFEPVKQSNPLKVAADIKVNTLDGDFSFYKSLIVLEYDTSFFGSNIAQKGAVKLEDGDISSSPACHLIATDLAPNKLQLKFKPTGSPTAPCTINTKKSFLARIYLNIENPLGNFEVNFDYDAMKKGNYFYDEDLQKKIPFECIQVENGVFPLTCPDVISFSTSTGTDTVAAGTGDIITILGAGFGTNSATNHSTPPAGSSVLFRRVQQMGSPALEWMLPIEGDYLLWTDTLIKVKVPSFGHKELGGGFSFVHAGTGRIGVMRDACIDSTETDLYVNYTAINEGYLDEEEIPTAARRQLTNRNGEGGYDLYFTSSFKELNDSTAVTAFKSALTSWRCATGVNFGIKELTDIQAPYLKNACKIDYGKMPVGVSSSLVAFSNIDDFAFCTNTSSDPTTDTWFAYLKKFELIFNDSFNWYSGALDTTSLNWMDWVDLETVALHELGHAHLLAHSNNPGNVMYHVGSEYKRDLSEDDLGGGLHIIQMSTKDTLTNLPTLDPCQPAMQKIHPSECDHSKSVTNTNN